MADNSADQQDGPFSGATRRLGEALIETGRITQAQLNEGLAQQKETGQFLGEVLVELGHIEQEELTPFLVKHCKVPYVSLLDYLVDTELLQYVPESVCLAHQVLPVDKLGRNLTVAMVNPMNQEALNALEACGHGLRIKPILCEAGHFRTVSQRIFEDSKSSRGGATLSMSSLGLSSAPSKKSPEEKPTPQPEAGAPAEEAPVTPAGEAKQEPEPVAAEPAAENEEAAEPKQAPRAVGSARNALAQSLNSAMQDVMTVARSSMHDTYEILARRIDLFRGLKIEEVAALFACGATREVEPDTTIFEKGQASSDLYVILGGKVRILDDGKEIAILATGDMFGEMALVTGEPRSATAVTAETTSLFILNEAVFQRLLSKQVAIRILLNMLGTMSLRLRQSNDMLRSIVK